MWPKAETFLITGPIDFGNRGWQVALIQSCLAYNGFLDNRYITGKFFDRTREGLRAFQISRGIIGATAGWEYVRVGPLTQLTLRDTCPSSQPESSLSGEGGITLPIQGIFPPPGWADNPVLSKLWKDAVNKDTIQPPVSPPPPVPPH